ncbi:MAG TPA: SRPBCC domain-containing protein [Terriglobales bacterium]|nr:SRPBCC domain-containing protein [Terriglobales bacterium]
MATATITPDQGVVQAEIFIAAPPERVFQSLTDPSQVPQWWGDRAMYRVTEFKGDVRPGGKWTTLGTGSDGSSFRVEGEYLEVDPPRVLVYTWNPSYAAQLKTVVRCEIEPRPVHGLPHRGPQKMATGSIVRIRHSGFTGNREPARSHSEGWTRVLGWLQLFVEKAETVATRAPVSG